MVRDTAARILLKEVPILIKCKEVITGGVVVRLCISLMEGLE